MGRCNNKRAQQAAQALRNTPSRARFSKGPPRKNKGRGGRNAAVGRGNSSAATAATNARVIDKISKRVEEKSKITNSSIIASTGTIRKRHPLDGVDFSKLDEVTLSNESIEMVTRLLKDLNVVETDEKKDYIEFDEAFSPLDDDEEAQQSAEILPQSGRTGGYSEYDDDVADNEEEYLERTRMNIGQAVEDDPDDGELSTAETDTPDDEAIQSSPVFKHLTEQLSFSKEDAQRACLAIEDWDIPDKQSKEKNGNDSLDSDHLALAMDWLCLHLTDEALKKGFRPNSSGMKRPTASSSNEILLAGTGRTRPIPHSSISVARPITSDREWRDTLRRQVRKGGFLRLGFHHTEAEKACDATMHVSEKLSAEDDEDGLRVMLALLEKDLLGADHTESHHATSADLEFARQEQEQERQALEAIYDADFQVKSSSDSGVGRYIVSFMPNEDLRPPAHSEECNLHVFLRPGYPVLTPPLLLFTNPTLPPSLLRRVNEEMIRQAKESTGEPIVFSLVDFLSNSLPAMQVDFIKEQRTKEIEAEQLRMRRDAGHDIDSVIETQYENDGKIGRRQKAKLRAAEKSFDRENELRQAEEERRRRQEERLEKIKGQEKSIRQTFADRAVEQRAKQRMEEDAEHAARAAMNDAFNEGETADVARAAARQARRKVLRDHGEEVSSSEDEENEYDDASESGLATGSDDDADGQSNGEQEPAKKTNKATPTTQAFMDRLRKYYYDAAEAKAKGAETEKAAISRNESEIAKTSGTYHFSGPKKTGAPAQGPVSHVPRPVPVQTGELVDIMNDVVRSQSEQPWLISPEARVPVTSSDPGPLSPEESRQMKDISNKLRNELKRKIDSTEEWKGKNAGQISHADNKGASRAQRFHSMMSQRQRLPAYEMRNEIVRTIAANQITVISGATGCGKTTQVPQLVLDDMILQGRGAEVNMIVTQPRRISAIGVSERIAAERCERVGETAGYSIRLENKRSARTRLLLCTTGIMLRRLQCDPDLASISHIFVDEVHERDLNTDFLLIILKDLLARRKSLKLVLMSATLNAETFSAYFGGCPTVSIPGRAHPVQELRLEDILQVTNYEVAEDSDYAVKNKESRPVRFSKSALREMYYPKYSSSVISSLAIVDETVINYELLALLLEHITLNNDEGAILVFMPGMMEITKMIDELYKKEIFQSSKAVIYPLHSSLSTAEQTAVFDVPPEGVRKIVVATNIAETSITIEDVVYVVDAGRVKENRKDEINEMPTLVEAWVSRASAKQRRGRAGRVRPGIAYHCYSSHTYEHEMEEYQLPEMLRVGLEDLVLQILLLDLGEPTSFLARAVNPPSALAMRNSLKLLEGLGAVEIDWTGDDKLRRKELSTSEEDGSDPSCNELNAESGLTALGFHLATLPVDPRVGKMMIYGALFHCVDPALTIAASMSARSPFVSPFDKRDAADAARKEFATDGSDHLTTLKAFEEWKRMRQTEGDKATQEFLRENFLSRLTLFQMEDLRRQFSSLLVDIGFLPKGFRLPKGGRGRNGQGSPQEVDANANSSNTALVKAVLCAGLYPNIMVAPRTLVRKDGGLSDKTAGESAFQSLKGEVYLHPCTILYSEKRLDSRYCCYHDIVRTSKTYVRDCTTVSEFALLLFGGSLKVYHTHGVVTIDEWLKFRIDAKPATLVKHLRAQMEAVLLQKIVSPEEDVMGTEQGRALIQAVSTLLAQEMKEIPEPSGADIVRPWTFESQDTAGKHHGRGGRSNRGGRSGGRRGPRGSGRGHGRSTNR